MTFLPVKSSKLKEDIHIQQTFTFGLIYEC